MNKIFSGKLILPFSVVAFALVLVVGGVFLLNSGSETQNRLRVYEGNEVSEKSEEKSQEENQKLQITNYTNTQECPFILRYAGTGECDIKPERGLVQIDSYDSQGAKIGHEDIVQINPPIFMEIEGVGEVPLDLIKGDIRIKTEQQQHTEWRYTIYDGEKEVGSQIWDACCYPLAISKFTIKNDVYLIITSYQSANYNSWLGQDLYIVQNDSLRRISPSSEYSSSFRDIASILLLDEVLVIEERGGGRAGARGASFGYTFTFMKNGEISAIKDLGYGCPDNPHCYMPISHSVIKKDGLFYLFIRNGYAYAVRVNKGDCLNDSLEPCAILADIGVDEYYLINRDGFLTKTNSVFKEVYLKEAADYAAALNAEDWGVLNERRIEIKEWYAPRRIAVNTDWLSLVLGKTLNYVFAGEDEKVWTGFENDFQTYNTKYPIYETTEITADDIQEEVVEDLREKK